MDSDKAICEAMGKAHDDAAGVESTFKTMDATDDPSADEMGRVIHPVDAATGGVEDWQAMYEKALDAFEKLRAHLISKGYGHNAIKRILNGEVVR